MESPDANRPPSPAQSDATEVADTQHLQQRPQSLSGEIDHIKSLISRSATSARPPENSITAQVFRTRTGSSGGDAPVSQQRLFHELDHLKKRIKHEQVLVRRPSQIDPETESESEDAIDEREEELENIRERLIQERRQSEDLLSAAEYRIDSLTNEKEDLSDLLDAKIEELAKLQRLKVEADSALADSTEKMKDLENKARMAEQEMERLTADHKHQLENIESQREQQIAESAAAAEGGAESTRDTDDLSNRLTIEQQENDSLRAQMQTKDDLHQKEVKSAEERIAQMESTVADFQRRVTIAEDSLKQREDELAKELAAKEHELVDVHRELSELHKKLYDQPVELQGNNAEPSQATETRGERNVSSLQTDLAKALEGRDAANRSWADEVARLKAEQEDLRNELQKGWSSKAEQAESAHHAELSSTRDHLQKEIAELGAESDRRLDGVNEDHAKITKALRTRLENANKAVESGKAELALANEQHWKQLFQFQEKQKKLAAQHAEEKKALEEEHQQMVGALRATNSDLENHLNELKTRRDNTTDSVKLRIGKFETQDLKKEHERAMVDLIESHRKELASVRSSHQRQLAERESSLRTERDIDFATQALKTKVQQQEAVDQALNEAQESSRNEIAALKKSHKKELSRLHDNAEKELASALANADDDLEERLRSQSKAHRKELDKLQESLTRELTQLHVQLEEASQLRQTQMDEAETRHRGGLANLGEKLQSAEEAALALQARLDAELTGRAEAERSLASFKKQRFEEDRTHSETKEELQKRIKLLEIEVDNLKMPIEPTPILPNSDPQDKERDLAASLDGSEDISVLKEKLAVAEQERDEAQSFTEQRVDEVARQNKFLVKELEMVMAQRSAEQSSITQADAGVQTEPVDVAEKDFEPGPATEPKADMATSQAAKVQRAVSHASNKVASESDDKRKSFEDYLLKAQAELAGLDEDMNENEELFSEKIQEHLADLIPAKEELSAEYERKFKALIFEKGRMERAVSAKNAAEFMREREELLSRYGISHPEPTKQAAMFSSLPSRKKKALRTAEERLVAEYTRRVTKRKSQIAVKHAEKFQSLTQDYNRRLMDVFGGRDNRSSVSSAISSERLSAVVDGGNARVEHEQPGNSQIISQLAKSAPGSTDQAEADSTSLTVADTTPKSRLPQRISISKPRTPTSIPRAMPYRGNWAGSEAKSPALGSSPVGSPAAETRNSSQVTLPTVVTPGPEGSDPVTPGIVEAFRRLSIEANEPEGDGAKPDAKSLTPSSMKLQRPRPRQMRHSSRAIFGFQASEG